MAAISHMVTISCMVATMVAMVSAIFHMVAIWPSIKSAGVNMVAIFQIRRAEYLLSLEYGGHMVAPYFGLENDQ